MAGLSLTSPLLAVLVGMIAVGVMLRTAPRFGAHNGRVVAIGLLIVAMASYANAYFAYFPHVGDVVGPRPWPVGDSRDVNAAFSYVTPPARAGGRGVVVSIPVPGRQSGTSAHSALVYLPPQYLEQPHTHFPVLYLLHGSPGVPLDWFRGGEAAVAGLAAARAGVPVILVAPRMSAGWLDDSECMNGRTGRWETYLTSDVVPLIDARLRTQPTASSRGIAGNSAGGYCALAVGLRHPGLFHHIVALSPLTKPTYSYGSLKDLFGRPADLPGTIREHTPLWLLQNREAARGVELRLEVGQDDPVAADVRRFAASARALGSGALLVLRNGGHTFRFWRPALQESVLWFGYSAQESTPGQLRLRDPGNRGQTRKASASRAANPTQERSRAVL